jgi:6-phosphogluconolactonase
MQAEFFFDLGCPFTYLAAESVDRAFDEVTWVPACTTSLRCGSLGADPAAEAYEHEIREHVVGGPDGVPLFDVIMCGLGPDGHTCSLFPGYPEVEITDRLVAPVHDAPKPPPDRVTFTFPLLNTAREVVFLVAGADKAAAVARAFGSPPDESAPAALVRPGAGKLMIVLDEPAAAELAT